jgi:hypothetical protein
LPEGSDFNELSEYIINLHKEHRGDLFFFYRMLIMAGRFIPRLSLFIYFSF